MTATRTLGSASVGSLGLGCMGMTVTYGVPDRSEAAATLRHAVDRGVTHFDTADMYGNGENERFLGQHLAPDRDSLTIATKTGIRTVPGIGIPLGVNGTREYIRRSAERSLRRLNTDRVDLYYLHRVDPRVPIEESIGAMADLVAAGKVRDIGVCEVTADQLRRAHDVHPLAAVQAEWSLFSRDSEHEILSAAEELDIAVVAYSPLGRGMLTGAPTATTDLPLFDFRRTLPRWRRSNLAANLTAVDLVREVARQRGATPGQVALAWLLARSPRVLPIPGTKRRKYLEENLGAAQVDLSAEDLARLAQVSASGARYRSGTGVPGTRTSG